MPSDGDATVGLSGIAGVPIRAEAGGIALAQPRRLTTRAVDRSGPGQWFRTSVHVPPPRRRLRQPLSASIGSPQFGVTPELHLGITALARTFVVDSCIDGE